MLEKDAGRGLYGTSKKVNQVQRNAMAVARVAECQNLNSGSLGVNRLSDYTAVPTDEGTEFIILFGWQSAGSSLFSLLVGKFLFE